MAKYLDMPGLTYFYNQIKSRFASKSDVGKPSTANTISNMNKDKKKVYVYTGSETGMTFGDWYYYEDGAWHSGGQYRANVYETDKTLAVADKPADGKKTGDGIADLKSALKSFFKPKTSDDFTWIIGKSINNSGNTVNSAGFAFTQKIDVPLGASVANLTNDIGYNNKDTAFWMHEYNANGVWLRRIQISASRITGISSDCTAIRIVYGYPEAQNVSITDAILESFFSCQIYEETGLGADIKTLDTELSDLKSVVYHDNYFGYSNTSNAIFKSGDFTFDVDGNFVTLNGVPPIHSALTLNNNVNGYFTSSAVSGIQPNVSLLGGHRYRLTVEKISGQKTIVDNDLLIFGFNTSTIIPVSFEDGNKSVFVYDISGNVNIALYLYINNASQTSSFANYKLLITFEDITNVLVTPQMYGAKGDGVSDDTAAFQNAINHGTYVYIPNNHGEKYLITDSLRIASGCKEIYGDVKGNPSSLTSKIIFDLSGRTDLDLEAKRERPLFYNPVAQSVHFENLSFDCPLVNGSRVGMLMSAQQDVVDYDMDFVNLYIHGFRKIIIFKGRGCAFINCVLASCNFLGDFKWSDEDETNKNHPQSTGQRALRFQNNRMHNISKRFLYISSGHAYGLVFTDNVIDNGAGVLVLANHEAWNWNISGNLVQGIKTSSPVLYFKHGLKNCIIANNVFSSDTGYWRGTSLNPKEWIRVNSTMENCNIIGNNIKNALGSLINIEKMFGSTIVGNVLQNPSNITLVDEDGKVYDKPIDDTFIYNLNDDLNADDDPTSSDYQDSSDDSESDDVETLYDAAIYIRSVISCSVITGNSCVSNNPNVVFYLKSDDAIETNSNITGNSFVAVG